MKKLLVLALLFVSVQCFAQKSKNDKPAFKFEGGAQKIDRKLMKDPKPTALVMTAVRFNTSIMHHDAEGDKAFSKSHVDAYTWAHLQGLSSDDFQEITDDFHDYIQKKLHDAGFSEVTWNEIEKNSSYQKEIERPEERNKSLKDGSAYAVFTGKNRPFFKPGPAPMSKMARVMKCNVMAIGVELNFADLGLAIEKSYSESTWEDATKIYTERKLKYGAESSIVPVLKLQTNPDVLKNISKVDVFGDYSMVIGTLQRPLLSNDEFVASLEKEDVADNEESSGKKILKALNPNMTGIASTNTDSYTVTANPTQFKSAAKELLRQYADIVVETMSGYEK